MPIGPAIRRMFGRHEYKVAALYRSIFIDLDAYMDHVREWVPHASNILEVGCGEGAVTERLVKIYPQAKITAIDITPNVGRLYSGPPGRANFIQTTVQEIAAKAPNQFDLVILSDVIHHVPVHSRTELMESVRDNVAPGGRFIFKDWEKRFNLAHLLCLGSDRLLTGDKVEFMTANGARKFLEVIFGTEAVAQEGRIKPWRNNFAFLLHG